MEAAEKYIADAEARDLGAESLKKGARKAIERLFLGFCTTRASGC
jgi:hypothetical protein